MSPILAIFSLQVKETFRTVWREGLVGLPAFHWLLVRFVRTIMNHFNSRTVAGSCHGIEYSHSGHPDVLIVE